MMALQQEQCQCAEQPLHVHGIAWLMSARSTTEASSADT